jgi:uncharacterized protein YjiS (DUF1127 family)
MFIMSLLANAQHALSEWRARHKAYAELTALDDRSLADIGIHRSEIPGLVFAGQEKSGDFEPKSEGVFAAHQARLAGGLGALPPL